MPGYTSVSCGCIGAGGGALTALDPLATLTEVVGVLCTGEFCKRSAGELCLHGEQLVSEDGVYCDKHSDLRSVVRKRDLLGHPRPVELAVAKD